MKYYKIFFPVLILLLLIVPLLHMNMAEITEQENRTLAKFPEIKKNGKINSNYSKEFESWLGDRFWGRDKLIDTRFQALYKINARIENDKAFVGDDGWMFEKWNTVNIPPIKKQREKVEKDVKILKAFADKFKGKDIPIYLVIIPDREQLYQKYWGKYYKPKPRLDYGEEMIKLLKDYPNIKIIYPKNEFELRAKYENLFFKDDIHLTHIGSKLLLESFLRETNYGYSEQFKIVPRQYKHHYLSYLLGIKPSNEEHYGYAFTVKSLKNIKPSAVTKDNGGSSWPLYINYSSENAIYHKNLYVLGVCYGYNSLLSYLSYLFKNSYYLRIGRYKSYNETNKSSLYFQQIFSKIRSEDVIILIMQQDLQPLSDVMEKLNN